MSHRFGHFELSRQPSVHNQDATDGTRNRVASL
jgi:hypothetical protein